MNRYFIIAYDIVSPKRAYRVRKLVYEYAMGGQKSALEVLVSRRELKGLICRLEPLLDSGDSVNIVEVGDEVVVLGRDDRVEYDEGVIIV